MVKKSHLFSDFVKFKEENLHCEVIMQFSFDLSGCYPLSMLVL